MGFSGPPIAQQKEMKKIVRLGEDVKITCPILGNPTPIVEWKKGGETIDYSWIRIRTQKKSLKIRRAQEEDTGVYVCKGVNGFGNVEVRVDLIIIGENDLLCHGSFYRGNVLNISYGKKRLDTVDVLFLKI